MGLKILNTNLSILGRSPLKTNGIDMRYEIRIINKHHKTPLGDFPRYYIGRGSALGNPYPITKHDTRDMVCDLYEANFDRIMQNQRGNAVLPRMCEMIKEHGGIELECFCAPKRCHGETIKRELERMLR